MYNSSQYGVKDGVSSSSDTRDQQDDHAMSETETIKRSGNDRVLRGHYQSFHGHAPEQSVFRNVVCDSPLPPSYESRPFLASGMATSYTIYKKTPL